MKINELKNIIREIVKKQMNQPAPKPAERPGTRPEPTTIPTTKPKIRPNPLRPPKEAPKPKPKYMAEVTPKAIHDKALNKEKNRVQTSQRDMNKSQGPNKSYPHNNLKDKNHLMDLIYKGPEGEKQKSSKINESEKEAFKKLIQRWKNLKK